MSEELKAGDRVIFTPARGPKEAGRVERTLPRTVIVEFDTIPGQFFQVRRDMVEKEEK